MFWFLVFSLMLFVSITVNIILIWIIIGKNYSLRKYDSFQVHCRSCQDEDSSKLHSRQSECGGPQHVHLQLCSKLCLHPHKVSITSSFTIM